MVGPLKRVGDLRCVGSAASVQRGLLVLAVLLGVWREEEVQGFTVGGDSLC